MKPNFSLVFVLTGLFALGSVASAQGIIDNGSFDSPPPATGSALPAGWIGSASSADPAAWPVAALTPSGYAAWFVGSQLIRQSVNFSLAGLSDVVVTRASLTMDYYNPSSAINVTLAGKTATFGPATYPGWRWGVHEFASIDLFDADDLVIETAYSGGDLNALVDNVTLTVLETRPLGGGETPATPTPTSPFTPTPTGTPPTPTGTATPTDTPTPEEGVATPTPTPTLKEVALQPAGILVTANPSLLLLPAGSSESAIDPVAAGIVSIITIELISEAGTRMDIMPGDIVDAEVFETGGALAGDLAGGDVADGIATYYFYPKRPGMAVIRAGFQRYPPPGDSEAGTFVFTQTVNVQVRKDHSGTVLGGDGIRRARLSGPPREGVLRYDTRR